MHHQYIYTIITYVRYIVTDTFDFYNAISYTHTHTHTHIYIFPENKSHENK